MLGPLHRGQLLANRNPSNNGDSNNRESSLDDSGVVDDHEEGDVTSEDVAQIPNVVQVSSACCKHTVCLTIYYHPLFLINGILMSIFSIKNLNMCEGFDILYPENQFLPRDTVGQTYDVR